MVKVSDTTPFNKGEKRQFKGLYATFSYQYQYFAVSCVDQYPAPEWVLSPQQLKQKTPFIFMKSAWSSAGTDFEPVYR